jgi:hypothetical protein
MVRLAQIVYLSCTDTKNVSKRIEARFHLTHVTYEFHRVRPKLFLSLCYVRRKPCTYLASRLALSLDGLKQASNWASSPGVSSGSSKRISEPKVCLAQIVHLSCIQTDINEIQHDPHYVGVPSNASKMISEPVVRSAQTMHLPCTIFKWAKTSFQLSLKLSSTIGCVQNDFWVYGTFGTNHAHILHRH